MQTDCLPANLVSNPYEAFRAQIEAGNFSHERVGENESFTRFSAVLCGQLIPHLHTSMKRSQSDGVDLALARVSRIFRRADGTPTAITVHPKPKQPQAEPIVLPPPSETASVSSTEYSEQDFTDVEGPKPEVVLAPVPPQPRHSVILSTVIKEVSQADQILVNALQNKHHMFVVCDSRQRDLPIIFASPDFCEFTGYPMHEILGINCRFLQGKETHPESVDRIRHCLRTLEPVVVCILNYKKDGTKFWNHFYMCALFNEAGDSHYFLGIQIEVTNVVEDTPMGPDQYLQQYLALRS
eukprot:c14340_g1_i1.p1 GENE.c14340_g1_i1~~c14340_g1_i1.p1  ORF type:complete len:296 (-),score=26.00 c14340_g1_i1:89-976(-)